MKSWRKSAPSAAKPKNAPQIRFWQNATKGIMPLIYADTSALFAYFHPRDAFSNVVDIAARKASPDFAYWQLLRFELRHNLRQTNVDNNGAAAWMALRAAEKTSSRLRWQSDLSADRLIDAADELSAEMKPECGCADILHVVAARRIKLLSGLDEFWTCDESQSRLARKCGLATCLFVSK